MLLHGKKLSFLAWQRKKYCLAIAKESITMLPPCLSSGEALKKTGRTLSTEELGWRFPVPMRPYPTIRR